ncbi:MAG: FHA domain-containing protein [Planctomycetota bacterium]|nr:FHA domain-containing protein [Planctomycetota bacterium]
MKVQLTIVQGKPEGKEFVLPVNPFVIGRAEGCHLRSKNETVSDQHCAILVKEDQVYVRDLTKQDATRVNGEPVKGEIKVKTDDLLNVGPLVFAIKLLDTASTETAPQPEPVNDTASDPNQEDQDDGDVDDWLTDDDDDDGLEDMDALSDTPDSEMTEENKSSEDPDQDSEKAKEKSGDEQALTAHAANDILRKYFTREE